MIDDAMEKVAELYDAIKDAVVGLYNTIVNFLTGVWDNVVKAIKDALFDFAKWFVEWISSYAEHLTQFSWTVLENVASYAPFDLSSVEIYLQIINYWFPLAECAGLLTIYMGAMLFVWVIRITIKLIPTIG
jgi:hypothetical protein